MSEKMNAAFEVPKDKFRFVPMEGRAHDKKLETKPVGYFRDAMNRFRKNKGSVVAAWIILILVLYAIFVPIFCETSYSRALTDTMYLNYTKLPPKIGILGIDGCSDVTVNSGKYNFYRAIAEETGLSRSNVRVILHRCRKKLKEELKKEGFEI